MADPSTILAHLQLVGAAAIAICDKIDNTPESENALQRQSLKELRKAVDSLRSDTLMYKDLLNAMENDTDLSRDSSYTRFIQRYVMGRSQAHVLTELIIYTITDRTERKGWKALKERSMLPDACSRRTQREVVMKSR